MNGEIDQAARFCEERKVESLAGLVPKVVDPNAVIFVWDRDGQLIKQGSLLQIAAYCGAVECIQYLLDNKAEIDKTDEFERTPFYMTCISGYLNAASLLLENGANPNIKDMHGWSPLHRAVLWEHVGIINLLIQKGIDPNVTDNDGFTPLHVAAKWDHFEAAQILLEAGAQVNAQSARTEPSFVTRTPMELAFFNNRTKVGRVLRKYGGDIQLETLKKLSPADRDRFNNFGY